MSDWTDGPEAQEWMQRVRVGMLPKLRESAITISLNPRGETDVKFAVELGFSIMLGKPIIVVAAEGEYVAPGLLKVADAVVYGDVGDSVTAQRLAEAVNRLAPDET